MYLSLDTLPDNVHASLSYDSQRQWMEAYNNSIKKSGNSHHNAVFDAWQSVRNNSDCRYFAGFVSSDRIDKQNDSVNQENCFKRIAKQIERGGTMVDTHSNRVVGSFFGVEKRRTRTGNPGVYAWGVIYKGDDIPYCDATWDAIKKAFSCPSCHDIRKGFSIGGFALNTDVSCDGTTCHRDIIDLSIHEISVCQDPANPDAIIDDINMFAKSSEAALKDGDNIMKKAIEAVDPRQQEMAQAKPEDELAQDAEQKAEAIQGEVAPNQGNGGLEGAMTMMQDGKQEDATIPTVDEVKAFHQKVKNLDKIIRELSGIGEVLNAAKGVPADGQAKPGMAPGAMPTPEMAVQKGLESIITAPMDMASDAMAAAASGDVASMAGLPGKLAGDASGASSGSYNENPKPSGSPNNAGEAGELGGANNQPKANVAASEGLSSAAGEGAAAGGSAAAAGGSAAAVPIIASISKKPSVKGELVKECGCTTDAHTQVSSKNCPMDKTLYGDQTDPAKLKYLDNKEADKLAKTKDEKLPNEFNDQKKIKGEKTAPEGPDMKEKEEKKLPESVMKNHTCPVCGGVKKAEISNDHLAEDMDEEESIIKDANNIKDKAEEMHKEDEEELEKSENKEQKKFKAKYKPKVGKKSSSSAKLKIKNFGKEGKSVFMKSDMEQQVQPEAQEGEVGMPGAEAEMAEAGEEIVETAVEQELSAKELIQLVVDFLEDNGISLTDALEVEEAEGELEQPAPEVTEQEIHELMEDPEKLGEAETLGKMAMWKFRARMTENRLNMKDDRILDYLQ